MAIPKDDLKGQLEKMDEWISGTKSAPGVPAFHACGSSDKRSRY
jgi:hypothetical protein